jgi:hypothetical protein
MTEFHIIPRLSRQPHFRPSADIPTVYQREELLPDTQRQQFCTPWKKNNTMMEDSAEFTIIIQSDRGVADDMKALDLLLLQQNNLPLDTLVIRPVLLDDQIQISRCFAPGTPYSDIIFQCASVTEILCHNGYSLISKQITRRHQYKNNCNISLPDLTQVDFKAERDDVGATKKTI